MNTLHVCKFLAANASRLTMQRGWDDGEVMDLALSSRHPLNYSELWGVVKAGQYQSLIFHMQSSLPYFVFAWFCRALTGRPLVLVYDIHDINERPESLASYMGFRFLCFYILEWFAIKASDSVLTVSRGLAKVYYRRYSRSLVVVRNIPEEPVADEGGLRQGLVYFGLINSVRLPGYLFEALELSGCCLNVYGRVDELDPGFIARLETAEARGLVKLHGTYSPDSLDFLKGYSRSLMIFEEGQANIRFCLPNKLYQSAAYGLGCLVSENLREVILHYGRVERFIDVAPAGYRLLAEVLKCTYSTPDRQSLLTLLHKERSANRIVYLGALFKKTAAMASQ